MALPGLMNSLRAKQQPPPKFASGGASPAAGMTSGMSPAAPQGNTPPGGGGGIASRVGGMMGGGGRAGAMSAIGGRGAPGGGPTGGMAGRVSGMFGGGAPGGAAGGGMGGAVGRVGNLMGGGGRAPAPQMAPRAPGGMTGMFALSDQSSKDKIRELEEQRDMYLDLLEPDQDSTSNAFRGVNHYTYDYKPEHRAETGTKSGEGPMAHELRPLGVTSRGGDGLERVDMKRLPLKTASEVGTQRRELDDTRAELDALRSELSDLDDDPDATLRTALGRR
jgi:hypothetical protein